MVTSSLGFQDEVPINGEMDYKILISVEKPNSQSIGYSLEDHLSSFLIQNDTQGQNVLLHFAF